MESGTLSRSLILRMTLFVAVSLLVISAIRTYVDTSRENRTTLEEMRRTAFLAGSIISHQVLRDYTLEDVRELQGFVTDIAVRHADILLAEILDEVGTVIASSDIDRLDAQELSSGDLKHLSREGEFALEAANTEESGLEIYQAIANTREAGISLERGTLHLRYSTAQLATLARKRLLISLGTTLLEMFALAFVLLFLLRRDIILPLGRMASHVAAMSRGDFRQFARADDRADEVGTLESGLQTMTNRLMEIMEQLSADGSTIGKASDTMVQASTRLNSVANEQASTLTEISATVREISRTAEETTGLAAEVVGQAQRSEENSREGIEAVTDTMEGMRQVEEQMRSISGRIGELAERMQQIGELISTVNVLTERSHLLALNASIEAAKAGESGRGFAVVATEMRALAEASKRSTEQVRDTIAEIQRSMRVTIDTTREGSERSAAAVQLSQKSRQAITRLAEVITNSAQSANQIASAAEQQGLGIGQASTALEQSQATTQLTVESSQQVQSAAQELQVVARGMFALVDDLTRNVHEKSSGTSPELLS